jgi:hypothetical protein
MNRTTLILAGIVLALAVAILVFGPAACNAIRGQKAQTRVTTGQLEATHESATDALGAAGNVAANEAAGADLSRTNSEEIHNAKGADVHVAPAVNAAGVRAICRRKSAAHDPKCVVQHAPPAKLENAR